MGGCALADVGHPPPALAEFGPSAGKLEGSSFKDFPRNHRVPLPRERGCVAVVPNRPDVTSGRRSCGVTRTSWSESGPTYRSAAPGGPAPEGEGDHTYGRVHSFDNYIMLQNIYKRFAPCPRETCLPWFATSFVLLVKSAREKVDHLFFYVYHLAFPIWPVSRGQQPGSMCIIIPPTQMWRSKILISVMGGFSRHQLGTYLSKWGFPPKIPVAPYLYTGARIFSGGDCKTKSKPKYV